jgi:hypothetical protein
MMYQSTPRTIAMTTVDPMTAVSTHRGTAGSYARERIPLGREPRTSGTTLGKLREDDLARRRAGQCVEHDDLLG